MGAPDVCQLDKRFCEERAAKVIKVAARCHVLRRQIAVKIHAFRSGMRSRLAERAGDHFRLWRGSFSWASVRLGVLVVMQGEA